ncbi:MAG: hypothetical protein HYU25_08515 [Candidatus Rokubacteria bacterium]|nr:hypothetical protein [Candidatus Rokubacteria bacterium]
MAGLDLDDFDSYTAAEPYRERRFGAVSLYAGCKHSHVDRRRDSRYRLIVSP